MTPGDEDQVPEHTRHFCPQNWRAASNIQTNILSTIWPKKFAPTRFPNCIQQCVAFAVNCTSSQRISTSQTVLLT